MPDASVSRTGASETIYRLTIRENDDGWHWRVEVDVQNGRAWSGVVESYEYAVMTAARRMQSAIRSDQSPKGLRGEGLDEIKASSERLRAARRAAKTRTTKRLYD